MLLPLERMIWPAPLCSQYGTAFLSTHTTSSLRRRRIEEEIATRSVSPPSEGDTQKPTQHPPEKKRGGKNPRWKVPTTRSAYLKRNKCTKGQQGEQKGESKQSRRRRIKREKQVLRDMGTIVKDGEAGVGEKMEKMDVNT